MSTKVKDRTPTVTGQAIAANAPHPIGGTIDSPVRSARANEPRKASGRKHAAHASLKTDIADAKPKTSPSISAGGSVAQTAQPANEDDKVTSRDAVAAFVEARRKMASAKSPRVSNKSSEAAKGVADVVDKKVKTLDEVTPQPAPPPAAGPAAPFGNRGPAHKPVVAPKAPVGAGKGQGFKTGEFIVYPAHGVGQITAVEEQEVAGYKLELFVISFVKDKMILKVPLPKIASVGMRKLAEPAVMKRAMDTLTGRARVKRTMWSRRAQEYEAKINSGDLISIAEVVRDLYRSDAQPEQSYSERQLYEAALDRMAREIAAVEKLTDTEALKLIDDQLQKGPRRVKADEAEADDGDEDEAGIVEAA